MQNKKNISFVTIGMIVLFLGYWILFNPKAELSGSEPQIQKPKSQARAVASTTTQLQITQPETPLTLANPLSSDEELKKKKRSRAYKCMSQLEWELSKNCGDVCLSNYLRKLNMTDLADFIAEGFITENLDDIGKIENPLSLFGRYQKAMYLAGMLIDDSSHLKSRKAIDLNLATSEMKKLIKSDPENAALYFNLISIEVERGNLAGAQKAIQQMKTNAKYFLSYGSQIFDQLQKAQQEAEDPEMYHAIENYIHSTFYSLPKFKENIVKNEALNSSLKSFANSMVAKGLKDKFGMLNDIKALDEYSLGRSILIYDKKNPNSERIRSDKIPSLDQIVRLRDKNLSKELDENPDLMLEWITNSRQYDEYLDKLADHCDQQFVVDEFFRKKEYFRKSNELYEQTKQSK